MFARVYDRERNRYYKSIVYAILDTGYHSKAIVYDSAADCFALVDYFDKKANDLRPPTGNLCREFISATLLVKDEYILWADDNLYEKDFAEDENGHLNYRGSYIKALHLKWRKVD